MADKKRFDYSLVGLVKKEGVTTFNGIGIDSFTPNTNKVLANYGFFVMASRSLAGHENDSISEKKALIADVFDWLKNDCPKREKNMMTADEKRAAALVISIKSMRDSAEKAEKKIVEGIIVKMIGKETAEVQAIINKLLA